MLVEKTGLIFHVNDLANRKAPRNLTTWNIQGRGTKKSEVLSEIKKYKIDIAVLNETKKQGYGSEAVEGYIHYYSGVPKEHRAKAEVSILIKEQIVRHIKSWNFINERIMI